MKAKTKESIKEKEPRTTTEVNKIEFNTTVRRFTSGAYIPVTKNLGGKFVKVIIEVLE